MSEFWLGVGLGLGLGTFVNFTMIMFFLVLAGKKDEATKYTAIFLGLWMLVAGMHLLFVGYST